MKLYLVLIFFTISKIIAEPLILPFKKRANNEIINKDNIILFLVNNDIITNISFGSQNESFEISIKLQNDSTSLLSVSCPQNNLAKKFSENQSDTYEKLKEKYRYFMYAFEYGTLSKDNIILFNNSQSIKINNFKFMLTNTLWYDTQKDMSGILGLILSNKEDTPKEADFITQLKNYNITDSYVFGLEYKDKDSGFFYVGNYLHEFNKSYSENDLVKANAGYFKSKVKSWEINIDIITQDINNDEIILQEETYLRLFYEIGIIAPPSFYHDFIKQKFFETYINKSICQEKLYIDTVTILDKYEYIVCNKNDFKIESFPEINFYNSEMNFTFTLNYKDLFYEFEDKIYFLIVFPRYPIDIIYWTVGKPFFQKYKLFFDKDGKTIGLYEKEYEEKKNEKIIVEKNQKLYILFIVLSIFLLIALVVVLYYFLVIKKERKKRANELEDDVDYGSPYIEQDDNNVYNVN